MINIHYIRNLLHFDLGTSIRTSRPVLDDLARCYPATLELALFSIVIASLFGILFGIISAIRRNSVIDQAVRAVSVTGVSIPAFWFALLMLYFFYYKLKIFPGPGRLSNSFSAPQTVTGMYVLDSLLEGNPVKAMGCTAASDPAGHCAGSLYDGADHKNNAFQSAGCTFYGL